MILGASALVCYTIRDSLVLEMGSGHSTRHTSGKSFLHLSGHCSFLLGYHTRMSSLASIQALNLKRLISSLSKCIVSSLTKKTFIPFREGGFPCARLGEGACLLRYIVQKMLSYMCTKRYSLFCISDNTCSNCCAQLLDTGMKRNRRAWAITECDNHNQDHCVSMRVVHCTTLGGVIHAHFEVDNASWSCATWWPHKHFNSIDYESRYAKSGLFLLHNPTKWILISSFHR